MNQTLLSVFLFLFVSITAQADQFGSDSERFIHEIKSYIENCENEFACQQNYRKEVVFSLNDEINRMGFANTEKLRKISFEQAQIWGDTILEGDYVADGKTRLDRAQAVYKNNTLIAYLINYSERAWFVGDCNYNGHESSLKDCDAGRIIESSFVSPDLRTFFVDERQAATFAFDQN